MKIHEYQARNFLLNYAIPTTAGAVVSESSQAATVFNRYASPYCFAKVQVLMGGRGKAGGVMRIKSPAEATAFCQKFLGKPFSTSQSAGESKNVRTVLFTEDQPIQKEFYLGAVVDRSAGHPVLLFSTEGGMEIEEVAQSKPEAILKIHFSPESLPSEKTIFSLIEKLFDRPDVPTQISKIASQLAKMFVEKDLAIAEINPLALIHTGKVLALDAKIVIDDSALFRHPDFETLKDPEEEDAREMKAKQVGLNYVSMGGNIGCLVNGAGLAMATMDMIKLAGGEPSNFLDVGGGATADQVREGFKIILQDPCVEAILVNIFGGIMKCDVIAQGIIQASREIKLEVPLIARLEGTNVEEGRRLLNQSGLSILSCETIRDAAATAVKKAREYRERHVHSHR